MAIAEAHGVSLVEHVCVCARARVCTCVCKRVCAHVCVHARVCVHCASVHV